MRKSIVLLLTLILGVAMLAGCGGNNDAGKPTSSATQGATTTPAPATAQATQEPPKIVETKYWSLALIDGWELTVQKNAYFQFETWDSTGNFLRARRSRLPQLSVLTAADHFLQKTLRESKKMNLQKMVFTKKSILLSICFILSIGVTIAQRVPIDRQ